MIIVVEGWCDDNYCWGGVMIVRYCSSGVMVVIAQVV